MFTINLKTVCFHFRKKMYYVRDLHKTHSFRTSISLLFFLVPFPSFTLTLLVHIFSFCWTFIGKMLHLRNFFFFGTSTNSCIKVVSSKDKICSNL